MMLHSLFSFKFNRSNVAKMVFVVFVLGAVLQTQAQFIINEPLNGSISLHKYSQILSTDKDYTIQDFLENRVDDTFEAYTVATVNLPPNTQNHWVKIQLQNNTTKILNYYLETAKPTTDKVNLYIINAQNEVAVQVNGHAVAFDKKSVKSKSIFFDLELLPKQTYTCFIEVYSNGDAISIPVVLFTANALLHQAERLQVVYGIFYGLLLMAFTIYLFFYFALKNTLFLRYSLYLIFIAFGQASLDGFFHQYISPNGGWFNNRATMIFGLLSMLFFLRYIEQYLGVKNLPKFVGYIVKVLLVLIATLLLALVCLKNFIPTAYFLINIVGLTTLLSLIPIFFICKVNDEKVDNYFIIGILCLIGGFLIFILNNLNIWPSSFFTMIIAKIGTGLEVIFLSIAMSNKIRLLRLENERNYAKSLQQSKDINDLKNYFLSNLSHELRTPLNLVMAASASLENDNSDRNVIEKAKLIKTASKTLLSSINGIVNFTDIEKGTYSLDYQDFDLHTLLLQVKSVILPRINEKNLAFLFPDLNKLPRKLKGDADKLFETLVNLLDNAVKFTPSGEIVFQVEETRSAKDKTELTFFIRDTGIGIDDSKMNTIYESFTKHSSHDKREFEGLGLGLFVAKTFVDLNKGSIDILQNTDGGTSCKLSLNFDLVEEKEPKQLPSIENTKILLVEDNKMNQVVIKMFAKKWKGATLTITNNGLEALEQLAVSNFDIVLMDLQMPVMDGFEAIKRIRSGAVEGIFTQVPIIVITADNTKSTHIKAMELGADDFVTKPVIEEKLVHTIKSLLAKSAIVSESSEAGTTTIQ